MEVLHQIGIEVPLAIAASANNSRKSMLYAVRATKFSVDTKELDAALAKQELSISERLRYKFALENVGLL